MATAVNIFRRCDQRYQAKDNPTDGSADPRMRMNLAKQSIVRDAVAHGDVDLPEDSSPEEGARRLIHQLQNELDRKFPQDRLLVRQLEQGPPFDAPIEVGCSGQTSSGCAISASKSVRCWQESPM